MPRRAATGAVRVVEVGLSLEHLLETLVESEPFERLLLSRARPVLARAEVTETRLLTDWEEVRALAPRHILDESVVRERFEYDDAPGLQVAFVRAFRLEPVWRFPDAKAYAGCRSWVELPEPPPSLQFYPVVAK